MKCSEVRDNLGAFFLGGLEPEEDAEIRRHLVLCSGCRNELEEHEKLSQALEAAPPPADPPGRLKDELLSRVRDEKSSSNKVANKGPSSFRNLRFILPGVAAVALVAIVGLGTFFGLQAESPVATVQLIPTPEVVNENYWGVAEFYPQASGNQQIELKLNNLDEPGPHNFYEAWFSSGEKYISAGTFTTTDTGETRVWLTAPPEARNYRTLLITKQAASDDVAPSKEVVLRGDIS
jgi:hypothetical protein